MGFHKGKPKTGDRQAGTPKETFAGERSLTLEELVCGIEGGTGEEPLLSPRSL